DVIATAGGERPKPIRPPRTRIRLEHRSGYGSARVRSVLPARRSVAAQSHDSPAVTDPTGVSAVALIITLDRSPLSAGCMDQCNPWGRSPRPDGSASDPPSRE